MTSEAEQCVTNNLHWYGAVFRTHGLTGSCARGVWACTGQVPPYYSNALTVTPHGHETQVGEIERLQAVLGRSFTVGDRFAALDLAPLGFRPLFDATWVRLDATTTMPHAGVAGTTWRRVTSAADLERWESAWCANGSPTDVRVFLPSLLADAAIAVFAAWQGGTIIAGCAANRARAAVGFSNYFAVGPADQALLATAVGEVRQFADDMPIVGYERDETLGSVQRIGFRAVGPLRVWVYEPRDQDAASPRLNDRRQAAPRSAHTDHATLATMTDTTDLSRPL